MEELSIDTKRTCRSNVSDCSNGNCLRMKAEHRRQKNVGGSNIEYKVRANHPPKAASQYGNEVAMSIRSEDVAFHGCDSLFSYYSSHSLFSPPFHQHAVHAMATTAVRRPARNDLHCGWKNTSLVKDCAAVWIWGSP